MKKKRTTKKNKTLTEAKAKNILLSIDELFAASLSSQFVKEENLQNVFKKNPPKVSSGKKKLSKTLNSFQQISESNPEDAKKLKK